jgi:hypothetical protein
MKSGRNETQLILTCAGMEITWRYMWTGFLILAVLQRSFPLLTAVGAFAAAALCTYFSGSRNWRMFQVVLLHMAGFAFTALWFVYGFYYGGFPFFSAAWLTDLFRQPKNPQQWLALLLILFCLLLFWLGGRSLMKRPRDYLHVCIQFDKGLGFLFLLLLIKFLLQEKGGIHIEDPAVRLLVPAFFIFSLLSIGLARNQNYVQKSFRSGYHGIGFLLGFTTSVVLGGAALLLLFLPYLTQLADSAQLVLKEVARPLGPIIVSILRFLLGVSKYRSRTGISTTSDPDANLVQSSDHSGWADLVARGFGWILVGMIGLMTVVALWALMKYLVRWLMKKNAAAEAQVRSWAWLLKLLWMLVAFPLSIWNGLWYRLTRLDSAASIYAGILRWGCRSGLPPAPCETPGEYGNRLTRQFPKLKEEIGTIIEAFNREVYGQIAIDAQILGRILSARRSMRSPRHWPSRVRQWL